MEQNIPGRWFKTNGLFHSILILTTLSRDNFSIVFSSWFPPWNGLKTKWLGKFVGKYANIDMVAVWL